MTAVHPASTSGNFAKFRTPSEDFPRCGPRIVVDHDSAANFVPVNDADNWLHLVLAVAMIALGAAPGRRRDDTGQPVSTGGTQSTTPDCPLH